jgi:hypothetical protein
VENNEDVAPRHSFCVSNAANLLLRSCEVFERLESKLTERNWHLLRFCDTLSGLPGFIDDKWQMNKETIRLHLTVILSFLIRQNFVLRSPVTFDTVILCSVFLTEV